MNSKPNIFFIYAQEDQDFFQAINKQLIPFKEQLHLGEVMHCGKLSLAQNQEEAARDALRRAQVAVVLLSGDYFASPYYEWLHASLFQRNQEKTLRILPKLVRDCPYEITPYAGLLPEKPQPINKVEGNDTLFKKTVIEVAAAAKDQLPLMESTKLRRLLKDSLCLLNFENQLNALRTYRAHSPDFSFYPVNIFLIQGSPDCGHRLLIRSFLHRYDIRAKVRYLDFGEYYPNEHNIWPLVRDRLGLQSATSGSIDPGVITGQLANQLRNQPVVLQFDNVDVLGRNNIEVINSFWQKLQRRLKDHEQIIRHRFFLFLTDQSCREDALDSGLAYQAEDFTRGTDYEVDPKVICLLPPLKPVKKGEVEAWIKELDKHHELVPVLKVIHARKQHLLREVNSQLFLMEAVRKIARLAGFHPPEDNKLIKEL